MTRAGFEPSGMAQVYRACRECGREFATVSRTRFYCSGECRAGARRERERKPKRRGR